MALYQDTWELLKEKDFAKEYYKFASARSCGELDLSGQSDGYTFISKSLDHHMFFAMKRIKRMLKRASLQDEGIPFTSRTLHDDNIYPRIKNLVINSENISPLYSHRLICSNSFGLLLRDNCIYDSSLKDGKKMIERADRRVYGGGYGLALEWGYLLGCLSYFTATTRINRNDLLDVVIKMKTTGKMTYKDHMRDIVTDVDRYQFKMNPNILSDFNKYEIVNILETLLEKGLVREGSELSENPRKVMREVVDDYERGREASIKVLEKKIDIQGD